MGSCFAKWTVDFALDQVGYQCGANKWNKYADELDAVDYFAGCGKKQNLNYCAVFVCDSVYNGCTTENDPKYTAQYVLYQPSYDNRAAVVGYMADYFIKNGAWYTRTQEIERGDVVFFQNSRGLCHVGLVVEWTDDGFYTVEGNVNGGKVEKRFYRYSEVGAGYVVGFGRPRYDAWEPETDNKADNTDDTTPDPEPQPQPEPTKRKFKVVTNSGDALRLRAEPNTDSEQVGYIDNGTIIEVDRIVDGESIGYNTDWAFTSSGTFYNGNESGYCSCKYLEEV